MDSHSQKAAFLEKQQLYRRLRSILINYLDPNSDSAISSLQELLISHGKIEAAAEVRNKADQFKKDNDDIIPFINLAVDGKNKIGKLRITEKNIDIALQKIASAALKVHTFWEKELAEYEPEKTQAARMNFIIPDPQLGGIEDIEGEINKVLTSTTSDSPAQDCTMVRKS